jgi:hypothetical protein
MARSLLDWLGAVFVDIAVRAPFGIVWSVDSEQPPVSVTVRPADHPPLRLVLRAAGDLESAVAGFAGELQSVLRPVLGVAVPPCPVHGHALVAARTAAGIGWSCPEGDFVCAVGDYREALWPPGPQEPAGEVAAWLAARFARRGIKRVGRVGAKLRGASWVATVGLRPAADEAAVRAAAAPVPVEITWLEPVRTVRHREPGYRALSLRGEPMHLAPLSGTLRRPRPGDDCDFLIEHTPGQTVRVWLIPEHQRGPAGDAVLLDAAGEPFAADGDRVLAIGGFAPASPVEGEDEVFRAGELRVFE